MFEFNENAASIAQLTLSVLIILANLPVLYISILKRKRIGDDAILITAVAINDFFVGVCMLGYTIYKLAIRLHIEENSLFCQLSASVHLALSAGMCLSVLTLALFRYFTFVRGASLNINLWALFLLIATIICYLLSFLAAYFKSYSVMPSHAYCFLYFKTNTYGLIVLWFGLALCIIGFPLICIFYSLITLHHYKIIKNIQLENTIYSVNNNYKEEFTHQRLKGTVRIMVVGLLFCIETGPQLIFYLLAGVFKFERSPILDTVVDTMFRLTALTNPLLILICHYDFCFLFTKILTDTFDSLIYKISN